MADVDKAVRIIFQGDTSSAEAAVSSLNTSLGKIGDVSADATPKVDDLKTQVDQLGDKSSKIDLLGASLRAFAASLVFKEFVEANIEVEKFERGMTQLTGSSAVAAKEFEFVRQTANTMGISLFDATNGYLGLAAAAKGTALEGDAARSIFESVSFAMSTMGRSTAETEGALNAIQQMISKGTVSMEELRQQLGDRLPGALQRAAEGMGLTTEELIKLVSEGKVAASEFIPALDRALRNTFGDPSYVESYMASWNRLRNEIDLAFVTVGKAGAFDALKTGVQAATAIVVGSIAAFEAFGKVIAAFFAADEDKSKSIAERWGIFKTFAGEAFDEMTAKVRPAHDALFNYNETQAKTQTGAASMVGAVGGATKHVDELGIAFATLGIKSEQFSIDAQAKILAAFSTIAEKSKDPIAIIEAFGKTLKNVTSVEGYKIAIEELIGAWSRGTITTAQFNAQMDDAQKKYMELSGVTVPKLSTEMKKQEEQIKKTEEATQKYKLEMEKLASNERIKLIEAKVKLNIAEVEANAKIAVAAFTSIDKTIENTGKTLTDMLGLLAKGTTDWASFRLLTQAIETESKHREGALALQKKMIEAQIDQTRARTKALERGEALLKVEGAGLQPHLEAFMWEILRTIQVRVNKDGLALLTGA